MNVVNGHFGARTIAAESPSSAALERGGAAASHAEQGAAFGNIMADISKADGPVAQGSATPKGLSRPITARFEEGEKACPSADPIQGGSDASADAGSAAGPQLPGEAAFGAARRAFTAEGSGAGIVNGVGQKAASPTRADAGVAAQFTGDPAIDADLAPCFGAGGRHKFHDVKESKETAPNPSTPDHVTTKPKSGLAGDAAISASVVPSAGVASGLSLRSDPAAAPVDPLSGAGSDWLTRHPAAPSLALPSEMRLARAASEPASDLDLLAAGLSEARGPGAEKAQRRESLLQQSSGSRATQIVAGASEDSSSSAMAILRARRPTVANLAPHSTAHEGATQLDPLAASRSEADIGREIARLGSQGSEIKVSVIERRTHLPPVVEAAKPIEQIGNQILTEASLLLTPSAGGSESRTTTQRPAGASTTGVEAPQKPMPVMKTLDLRLEPESLGAVTIRLRLSGVQLEVQVEASHVQTMKLIRDDKDLLSAKLRSSGYAMDHLVVKLAEQQIGPAQTRAEAGQGHTFDGQSGNFTPSSELSQQGGSGANDRQAARRDQTTGFGKGDDAEDHARRGGDLYL
ncbi:hypothetical protein Msil_0039 [Methylocella silvestris BL2]|uniref:Flagellar hook-length control protein-like C-terminal domain-containing protein n=2 Tax=Methylocella silvestris TaxID=199596 RepID=B8EL27_METSB|nr:hypothetical protein Msil_0039 [Methylocella silvestris BL2]